VAEGDRQYGYDPSSELRLDFGAARFLLRGSRPVPTLTTVLLLAVYASLISAVGLCGAFRFDIPSMYAEKGASWMVSSVHPYKRARNVVPAVST
jgi:hypothetical protein